MDQTRPRTAGATIRRMLPADVPAAADAIRRGHWGDREAFFRFAAVHQACRPLVAEADGTIVGTGVATISGSVGWVGTIWVATDRRGRGLGRALTEAVVDDLLAAGSRTLVLVATELGRPVYEKLGFEVFTRDHVLIAAGLPPGRPDPDIRPFVLDDLPAAARLDARATGEDRRHLLEAFAGDGWSLPGHAGRLAAFTVRSSFRGSALIAPDAADALRLLEHQRRLVGPDHRVRAGVLDENADGLSRLLAEGWTEVWSGPRMIRGEPLDWSPTWIWSQFNHAIG